MYVIKRNGKEEPVQFDKVTTRIRNLCTNIDPPLDLAVIDPTAITQKVVNGIFSGVRTSQIDQLAAETAAYLGSTHPDFEALAVRIAISNLQKLTEPSFSKSVDRLRTYRDARLGGAHTPLIALDVYEIIMENAGALDAAIRHERDFAFSYQGYKTLERSYLLRTASKESRELVVAERPQHMWMRVAVGIHKHDIKAALATYEALSQLKFTHATPTLFNAGTMRPQMSSCFLLTMKDDSISGIYGTLSQCAMISKSAGGIGVSVHKIRARGSYISASNGTSSGLVPMLRNFNATARYVDQGGGRRKGAFAIYLEPWHADIYQFLELRRNTGKEEERARDLFYGLWIPDLFMRRVEADADWSLFSPNEAPRLADVYGADFDARYERYEAEGKAQRVVRAQELWFAILDAQMETGVPYMLYKDACNRKSNQRHLGTIRSSNLCTEIIQYTSRDEVAVCNLASVSLPACVRGVRVERGPFNGPIYDYNPRWVWPRDDGSRWGPKPRQVFDFAELRIHIKMMVRNLNRVIDVNFYPVPEAELSNRRHRPLGIGVQGLADVFARLRIEWESEEARELNRLIFECIYYSALEASCELAAVGKDRYESYPGSPVSEGLLQFDLWPAEQVRLSGYWNWGELRGRIKHFGLRNSLLVAPMPTASTSRILGNNECFEPYHSNIYSQRVLNGDMVMVNKHLQRDLIERGLWTPAMKNRIIAAGGSVQGVEGVPEELQRLYKTVWELPQSVLIRLAADRAPFIDQSQSLNVFMAEPTHAKLTSLHFAGWRAGLKTGMYYLRTKPAAQAIQFTVDQQALKKGAKTMAMAEATVDGAQSRGETSEGRGDEKPGAPKVVCRWLKRAVTDGDGDDDNECLSCSG